MHLLLFVLFGGGIGWGVVKLALLCASTQRQAIARRVTQEIQREIPSLIDEVDWEGELSPFLDGQLEKIVSGFKRKNPMLGMFLTQEMAAPLVKMGKEELLSSLPALKKKGIEKALSPAASKVMEEKIEEGLRKMESDPWTRKIQWAAFGAGACFGLVEGVFFKFFF